MRLELRRGRQRGKMARADEDTDDVSSVSAGSGIGAGSQPPSPSSVARVTHASDGSPIETFSASPSSRGTTHRAGSTFAQGHRWGPATPASSSTPRELDAHGSSAGASSGADDESRSHEALLSPMRARLRRSKSSPSANEPTRGSSGTGAFDDSLILSDEPPSPPRPDMDDGTADGGTSNSRGVLSTLMAVLYEIAAYWIGFVTTLLLPGESPIDAHRSLTHAWFPCASRASRRFFEMIDVFDILDPPRGHVLKAAFLLNLFVLLQCRVDAASDGQPSAQRRDDVQ